MPGAPKILAVASATDLDFRYGCTPAWWQIWKGLNEVGVDLIVTPYRGKAIESPWWRTAPNPLYREAELFAGARGLAARLKGDTLLRRGEDNPEDTMGDKLTREAIWRYVTPRWQRHLERILERERDIAAVIVFTVPMAHLRGIPTRLRERFDVPVVFYDGDVPMSLPEFGGMDTGFNYYHGADPSEYDLVLSNSEGGLDRLRELGARRAEAVFWGADPELFQPAAVEKEYDVFFYGYGDKFRREWMHDARRRAEQARSRDRLRARRQATFAATRATRAASVTSPSTSSRRRSRGPRESQHHAALARHRLRIVDLPAVRARSHGRGDRLQPARGHRALVRGRLRAAGRLDFRRGARRVPRAARRPGSGRGDGPTRSRTGSRRAHLCAPRTPDPQLIDVATPVAAGG